RGVSLDHAAPRRECPAFGAGVVRNLVRHNASSATPGRPLTPPLFAPNRFKGKLIIVEGIDGSGKSTQLSLLSQWLRSQMIAVAFSEWNSSPLVRETMRRGKKKKMLTPTTFSLLHATDFADRMERYILPLLKAGAVVCA